MKVIWEANDVRAGTRVRNPTCNEVWMIGFEAASHSRASPAFAIISLTDGMITVQGQTAEQIAAFLNDSGSQPVTLVGDHYTRDAND